MSIVRVTKEIDELEKKRKLGIVARISIELVTEKNIDMTVEQIAEESADVSGLKRTNVTDQEVRILYKCSCSCEI